MGPVVNMHTGTGVLVRAPAAPAHPGHGGPTAWAWSPLLIGRIGRRGGPRPGLVPRPSAPAARC